MIFLVTEPEWKWWSWIECWLWEWRSVWIGRCSTTGTAYTFQLTNT